MATKTGTKKSLRASGKPESAVVNQVADVPADPTSGARALIRAGLKALGEVPGDVVARQARIFELLLGIGQSPIWKAKARAAETPDPFGKFEAVFDQRVVRSLERLGMPSPQQLQELSDQVKALTIEVRKLQSKPRRR
jgi:Poly(hydroxyalcanoate) granule associated protein (phasin)